MQTVEASQSEERGRKHIGAEIDPGLKQFPILRSLADQEDTAEQDRQARASQASEPRRCFVRATSDRQKVKLLAKRQTLNTSVRGTSSSFGPGPACGPSVEIQIGKDKCRRRILFRKE